MPTLQLYRWSKASGVPQCIILGTSGHLSRTTDITHASWIALLRASSHMKKSKVPCGIQTYSDEGQAIRNQPLAIRTRSPCVLLINELLYIWMEEKSGRTDERMYKRRTRTTISCNNNYMHKIIVKTEHKFLKSYHFLCKIYL